MFVISSGVLAITAVVVLVFGLWITTRYLGLRVALPAVALRIAIPVVYFRYFFTGQWTAIDDIKYWATGRSMILLGFNPINALFSRPGFVQLESFDGGIHILYQWWNCLLFYYFGIYYFVPVVFNVGWSFVAAYYLYWLMVESGFDTQYARAGALILLLHPEIIAWSSFLDMKDTIVVALTVMAFYHILLLSRGLRMRSLVVVGLIFVALLGIRFYLPVVVVATFGFWMLLHSRSNVRLWLAPLVAGGAVDLAFRMEQNLGITESGQAYVHAAGALFGMVHMLLTPRPWSLEPAMSFLTIPAGVHWLLLPFLILGGIRLWKRSLPARLVLYYGLIMLALYAVTPELQGYRQRYQLIFVIAWGQWEGINYVWQRMRRPGVAGGYGHAHPGQVLGRAEVAQ